MIDTMPREDILAEAYALTAGERNDDYGPPHEDFARTAGALNALGYRGPGGRMLEPYDQAIILIAVKLSRIVETPEKRDHYADLAGYTRTAWLCIEAQLNAENKALL